MTTRERLIAVVHEEPDVARELKELVEFMDAPAVALCEPDSWVDAIGDRRLTAVFIGDGLGTESVRRVLDDVGRHDPNVPIVAAGQEPAWVRSDYPWARIHELERPLRIDAIATVLDEIRASHSVDRRNDAAGDVGAKLIGESADMRMIGALIERVAPSEATVLITGESGTGKEVVARRIHELSGRDGAFVAINCGAIPDHLLESELFGHERGAFTGAQSARAGRFEAAAGGTLFLDEIGDMPTAMQVKLLRVLQERVIERVGGARSIPVDIRVVAATHRDLQQRIEDGRFREDLYYRLSVFPIEVSPLRERPDDVVPLAMALIERVAANCGVRIRLTAAALEAFGAYGWPGNVRELANLIERLAVIRPHGTVDVGDLPGPLRPAVPEAAGDGPEPVAAPLPEDGLDLKEHLANIERDMIARALQESGGVVQKAAVLLGVGRTTLVEKIRRHNL